MKLGTAILASATVAAIVFVPAAALATGTAKVNVIHGIRGQDLGLAPELPADVYVNGNLAIGGFTFGTITKVDLPAGTYNIQVKADLDATPGAETTVINADVPLNAGENATIIAHLSDAGAPTASKFVNRRRLPWLGVPIAYHHTAAAPAVDVYQRLGGFIWYRVVKGAPNGAQAYTWAPRNTAVAVTPAGTFNPVLGPLPLTLSPTTNYFVYVVGSANGAAGNTLTPIVLTIP